MHHAIGVGLLIYCISYAFGRRTAQICVGSVLVILALAFLYVMLRIIEGTI